MKSFREFNQVSVEKYSQLSEHYDSLVEEGVLTENPLLRGAARFIPGLQQGYGIYRGTKALMKGDLAGAGLGYGSALPGPLGYGFAAADIARDMGFDPLNTKPGSKPQTQQQQQKPQSGMSAAELKAAQDQVNKLRQQGQMSNLPANYKQQELDAGAAAERFRSGAGLPRSGGGNQSSPNSKPPVLAVKGGKMGTFDRSTGKFTPRGFTDAEMKRFQTAGGKLPPTKSTSTPLATRAATAKIPPVKSLMNMPKLSTGTQTQSRLDKALSGIKPGAGVPGSQQGAQRVQKQIQKLKTSL